MSYIKKYFGTDGIRGKYGELITEGLAYRLGNTLGRDAKKIVVGRDTRWHGEPLSHAFMLGVTDAGCDVISLGIVTTPAVAYVTKAEKAKYGVVVSASHNPIEYNGLKIFSTYGAKLTDKEEQAIEICMDGEKYFAKDSGKKISGSVKLEEYYSVLRTVGGDLTGMRIGLDCANGAVSLSAGALFRSLGASVIVSNDVFNGENINDGCGALHPDAIAKTVKDNGLDVGFAFDGDADRIIGSDENGNIINGDDIIYAVAVELFKRGKLYGNTAVGTYHTNLGMEKSLNELGIKLVRTDIGDHFVAEKMRKEGYRIGGEQSGHIILGNYSDTGDGLLVALYLANLVRRNGVNVSKLLDHETYPQVNYDIITKNNREIVALDEVQKLKLGIERELEGRGRILLRASGTEPKIRIMAECRDTELAKDVADRIRTHIEDIVGRIR